MKIQGLKEDYKNAKMLQHKCIKNDFIKFPTTVAGLLCDLGQVQPFSASFPGLKSGG